MTHEAPEGWSQVKQGDVATFYNGRAYKKSEWEETGTPVIRLQNLTGRGDKYYYSKLELPEHQYCDKGDLLYMWSATFGPHIWQNDKAIYHYHIWKVICDETLLDKKFHYYLLDQKTKEWMSGANGMAMLHITKGNMEKVELHLPPLPEQKKIAEVLCSVDEAIAATKAVIDQTKQVKKGLLQTLLTKGIGHTKFKQTELGEIPESWEEVRLGDVAKGKDGLQTGPFGSQLKAAEYTEDGIPVVMPKDLIDRKISLRSIARTSSQKADTLAKHKLVKGDILFGRRGEIGRCGLVTENETGFLCGTGCLRARLNTSIVYPDFFIAYLSLPFTISWLNENAVGQTMLNLNTAILAALPIALPPLEEQRKIANVISEFDSSSTANSKKLDQLQTIKSGLMSDLLTGRKRVEV
ncbi:restriction endonuclease subunit S [Thalassospira lucentensis]|uniref:restriction endonuclease subunit S n=1 Tax=Thalassospira lucentensis TaxID=168935 RepID=UPI003AA98C7E